MGYDYHRGTEVVTIDEVYDVINERVQRLIKSNVKDAKGIIQYKKSDSCIKDMEINWKKGYIKENNVIISVAKYEIFDELFKQSWGEHRKERREDEE